MSSDVVSVPGAWPKSSWLCDVDGWWSGESWRVDMKEDVDVLVVTHIAGGGGG